MAYNVLIVDDNKEIREVVNVLLSNEGYIAVSYTHLDVYKRQAYFSRNHRKSRPQFTDPCRLYRGI